MRKSFAYSRKKTVITRFVSPFQNIKFREMTIIAPKGLELQTLACAALGNVYALIGFKASAVVLGKEPLQPQLPVALRLCP